MNTKITLDDAREAITSVIRKKGCRAAEVAAEEVKAELSFKGSNTTTGPLIRPMLDEAILAEILDLSRLSNRLKASFMAEQRKNLYDATHDLRMQLSDIARANDELRDRNAGITAELADLTQKSLSDRADAAEKLATTEKALAEAKGAMSTFEATRRGLLAQLDEAKTELGEKRKEIDTLKDDLSAVRATGEHKERQLEELSARLSKAEVDYQSCEMARALAKSKVDLLEERNTELKNEIERQVDKYDSLAVELKDLSKNLLEAVQAKARAEARLEELLKKPPTSSARPRKNSASRQAD